MAEGITEVTKRPLETYRLINVPRVAAIDAAHGALSDLQHRSAEECVMGAAVLFHTICLQTGLDPMQVHTMAHHLVRDAEFDKRPNDSLQSLKDFVSIRIMGRDTTVS